MSQTPVKGSLTCDGQWSPVTDSPIRSPATQGNLTGIPRKVKDSCVTVYNTTFKWKQLNVEGCGIFQEIAAIKLQAVAEMSEASNAANKTNMPPELEPLLDKMEVIHGKMGELVERLSAVTETLKEVSNMDQAADESMSQEPLFLTWSTDMFGTKCEELLPMYKKEFEFKEVLIKEIAHVQDKDTMTFYTCAWERQPYLRDSYSIVDLILVESDNAR